MIANELRIGNWVETYSVMLSGSWYDKDGKQHGQDVLTEPTIRQKQIDILDLKIISESPLATYRPIPLTPEILVACGFELETKVWWKFPDEDISGWVLLDNSPIEETFTLCYDQLVIGPLIQYLHQLQNLFFAITQTELNYNSH